MLQFVTNRWRTCRPCKIISGADLKPVITENFILVPNPGVGDMKQDYRVVFTAAKRAAN